MRKSLFLLATLSLWVSWDLYAQGVNFKPISIKEAIKLAKAENKNMFILFGTTHCGSAQLLFNELYKSETCGAYINDHFISVGYGDSTTLKPEKWFHSSTRLSYSKLEGELESLFCNYFIFPNYFFLNKHGEIVYINTGPKSTKKILRYSKFVSTDKVKQPFLFKYRFNNKVYPKNKFTYKMLSHCLNAYIQMDVPKNIDYKNDSIWSVNDFGFKDINLEKAKREIQLSLSSGDYYFNCFLASLIYYKSNNYKKSLFYAKKGLSEYPEHWSDLRKLSDKLMKEIIKEIETKGGYH